MTTLEKCGSMCELCTVMCAREKCASARVQVGVVSTGLLRKKTSCDSILDHSLDAINAPRCAGAAMSRALLYLIPDWPALSVTCTMLSSVKPGKSRSKISAARCSCRIAWP